MSLWLKINSHDITNHYFGFDNIITIRQKSGVNTQFYLGPLGGTMRLRMHLNGALPNTGDLTSNSSLSINTWYNIVYTWDGSMEKIYINGVLDNAISSTNYISTLSNSNMFCFGSYGGVGVGSTSTNSVLDDIGIWNSALDSCEVKDMYEGSLGNCCVLNPITTQPTDFTVPLNGTGMFSTSTSVVSPTYQWQMNDGTGYTNLFNTGQFSGVDTDMLAVSNVTFCLGLFIGFLVTTVNG